MSAAALGSPLGLAGGYAADLALGDPRHGHPVALFGSLALAVEARTYAPTRAAGIAHAALLVGSAAALGRALDRLLPGPAGLALGLWVALGGRSLAAVAGEIGALLQADDVAGARARINALVGRDPDTLDADGLARATIESLAENTVDAVVAPLLWAALAGTPGVLAHRAVNTLDAMVGHRTERYADFGWASARADDVANWPAARLGALLTCGLAPLAGGDGLRAARAWTRDADAHPSPNGGQVEAAFAGALGISLGGPTTYAGITEERPRLGRGPAPTPAQVAGAVRLSRLVGLAACALAVLASGARS